MFSRHWGPRVNIEGPCPSPKSCLTFNPQQAMVTTHTPGKGQGQRSVCSKIRVEEVGQTRLNAVPKVVSN